MQRGQSAEMKGELLLNANETHDPSEEETFSTQPDNDSIGQRVKPRGASKWTAYLAPNTNPASNVTPCGKSANVTGENPQEPFSTSTSTMNQRTNKWSSYLPAQETCSKNTDPCSNPDNTKNYGNPKSLEDSICNSNNKWSSYLSTQETHFIDPCSKLADYNSTAQGEMSQRAYHDDFGDMAAIDEDYREEDALQTDCKPYSKKRKYTNTVTTNNGQWRANLQFSPLRQDNDGEINEKRHNGKNPPKALCVENVATSNGQWRANLQFSPSRQNNEDDICEEPIGKNPPNALLAENVRNQLAAQQLGNRPKEPVHQSSVTSKKSKWNLFMPAAAGPPSEATPLPSGYDNPDLSPDKLQPEDCPTVLSTIPSNVHKSGPERGRKPTNRKENYPAHISGYPASQPEHNHAKPTMGTKKRHIGLRKVKHNAPSSKITPPLPPLVNKMAPAVSKPVLNERQVERVLLPQTDFAKRFLLPRRQ